MTRPYEINDLDRGESWRMFRIIGELVEGFDSLSDIGPAVSFYGSARLQPEDPLYQEIVETARLLGELKFSVITGGGPGVMEAANRGAKEAGAKSIGLNIELPEEQAGNPFTTKTISFNHFFVRKVMLVKYAVAFIILPGGLGTLDELTEVLTLMQTQKIRPFPVILYKMEYWKGLLEWLQSQALRLGYISDYDLDLVRVCNTPADTVEHVHTWYIRQEMVGNRPL
ncbi:TIGR00730 family Rossman fold protein [Chloroflexota bacterium]